MVGQIRNTTKEMRPVMGMVLVQIAYAGMNILYKLAADDGMKLRILVAYRLLFATIFTLPFAFLVERNKRPRITWKFLLFSFLSGLIGAALPNNMYLESVALTSATFSAAVSILVPASTFIMAVAFGLENLQLGTNAGKAKVLGTLVGIGGALVFTFCRGVEIKVWSTHVDLLHHHRGPVDGHEASTDHGSHISLLGALMGLGSNFCFSFWLLLQVKISKQYQSHYWNTALMSIFGTIQSVAFALCTERDWKEWRLGWNIRLLTITYTGILVSGLIIALLSWCIQVKGPLFVSIFSPLTLVIVALVGAFALDEKLHLGSIIGTVLIVGGLYVVLWGKTEETKVITSTASPKTNDAAGRKVTDNSVDNNINPRTTTDDQRTTQVDAHIEINP